MNREQNIRNLHEMVFIYNAVMDGWTVKKRQTGKIRLTKKTTNDQDRVREQDYTSGSEQTHIRQYDLDLVNFIQNNTQIDRIFSE